MNELLETVSDKSNDAKYNIFRFQDHLLEWISISAHHFQERDYPSAFEALTNVYIDSWGFFDDKEQEEVDDVFEATRVANEEYINYNVDYSMVKRKVKAHAYAPPTKIYFSLIKFRKTVMHYMAKHNMLMKMVKKGSAGAGDA